VVKIILNLRNLPRYSTCTIDHTQRATVSLASACTARRTKAVPITKTN